MDHRESAVAPFTGEPTMMIVPGLRGHVPDHWQTILAGQLPNARSVPPLEHNELSRAARVAGLDAAFCAIDGPVVLVAHSAGVMTTVHWAQTHRRPIHGALLATPADLEFPLPPGYPTSSTLDKNGWTPIPRTRLPFPSIVAASTNDPLASIERIAELASAWGSRLVNIGAVGHLNPAAGYGEWSQAHEFIHQLSQAVEHPSSRQHA